jgi:hypothetical protein
VSETLLSPDRPRRSRLWVAVVSATVVGLLVIAGGISLWRGGGAIEGGGSGSECATAIPIGAAALFGDDFENKSDLAVTVSGADVAASSGRVVASTMFVDRKGGIGIGLYPTKDPDITSILNSSRPVRGFVIPPHRNAQVIVKLYPAAGADATSVAGLTLTYTEAGKPFVYESKNTELEVVRSHGKC